MYCPTARGRVSSRVRIGLCFALLLACTDAAAQIPTVVPNQTPAASETDKAKGPDIASDAGRLGELRDKRQQAQAELTAISRPGTKDKIVPSGATQEELQERRSLLEQVVRGYDEQLSDADRLKEAQQRHADIVRSGSEWKGFADPPPYSILFADQLWDTAYSLQLAVDGLQSQLDLLTLRFDRAREALTAADERVRQASERLEAAKDPARAARERWLRDLDILRKQAASVMLSAAELSKTRVQEELADTRARLAFARRQLDAAEPQVKFTEADLDKVRARLSQERQRLEGEWEQTIVARRAQAQRLQEAERRLETRQAKKAARGPARETPALARAKAAVELARAQMDNLVLKGDLLQQMIDVVEGERQLWESRYAIAHSSEPGTAREAYNRLTPLFANFRAARDYLRQQVGLLAGRISELENRLRNTADGPQRGQIQTLLRTFREREDAYNHALQRVDQAARFLERWKSEFKEQQTELPLSARAEDWAERALGAAKTLWTFEVFSAEDTIEVDGKKITGRRSITVGKIVSALAILLIGYWICLYLARLIGRLAATRLGLAPEVSNLVRQWSQAVLLTILIVISLVSVKIPLTIFAFLGGAFAIGVGFGAQNLLKNVISGILLLIERPLRVGDLIEVDNVRGRVTTIGLRSSTVRDAKGMETLIPNSSFLERHLTNWTYSSRISRFSLRVGAPYGSSTQQVMELLSQLAHEHPHVLKIPQPQVLLDEFGAQARIFTLNYWLEIRLDVDPNQVASELRFAIEQKFAEVGLKILPAA